MTAWVWAGTLALFAVLIVVDLVATGRSDSPSLRSAALLSGLWVLTGVAFGVVLWLWRGQATAGEYFAGYLLEKALSVDNIFVFVLLFASLAVPPALQRRVLYLGVIGALVLRGGFIAAGGALIEHLSWIFYLFGVVVLVAGLRMFRAGEVTDPSRNLAVRGLRRILPVTESYHGTRLLVRDGGRTVATPLLVALVAIEVTDLIFALDSIPAVFGVTRDVYVVFTSNAFAVLGLRALYFLLAGSMDRFVYLKQGLAVLLTFIGLKMLVSPVLHLPVLVSLAVIVAVVGGAVGASLWRDRRDHRDRPGPADEPDRPQPRAEAPSGSGAR
jgi:tellurite resistance protein TerC